MFNKPWFPGYAFLITGNVIDYVKHTFRKLVENSFALFDGRKASLES